MQRIMPWIEIAKLLLQKCNNDSVAVHLFLHLLTTSEGSGGCTTTLRKLAEELKTTVKKITTRLAKLEDIGLITREQKGNKKGTKREQKGTLVTVCNCDSYTMFDLRQGNKKGTKREQKGNNPKEKENIPPTPPIKEKEIYKEKENTTINCSVKESVRFLPPTIEEVENYILEKGYNISASRFVDFYQSKGWYVGKNKMKDWKAAIRGWAVRDKQNGTNKQNYSNSKAIYLQQERERVAREVASINEAYIRENTG